MKHDAIQHREAHLLASDVSEAAFLRDYAGQRVEWAQGAVWAMPGIHLQHLQIVNYLLDYLRFYMNLTQRGRVLNDPFEMRLATLGVRRIPDIQVILREHLARLQPTYTDGPADICVEVVSRESMARDRGEKFVEYAAGGVREYWLIDPLSREAAFYRLSEEGAYERHMPIAANFYQTPLLPGWRLPLAPLWDAEMPEPIAILQDVQATWQRLDDET